MDWIVSMGKGFGQLAAKALNETGNFVKKQLIARLVSCLMDLVIDYFFDLFFPDKSL